MLTAFANRVMKTNTIAQLRKKVEDYYLNDKAGFDIKNARLHNRGFGGRPDTYIVEKQDFSTFTGLKFLGSGCYANVYAIDETRVLKIVKTSDSGYARYADVCKNNKNPHLPKILAQGVWGGKQIYILERLTSIQESEHRARGYAFMNAVSAFAQGDENPYLAPVAGAFSDCMKILRDNNLANDIHDNNIMMRGDVPVITDPVSEG
jgi:hypothetical protein